MDAAAPSHELCIQDNVLQPLLSASNSTTLNDALQTLIGVSRTDAGRSDLASKRILSSVLELMKVLSRSSAHHFLVLSLRLLRNLCAGEAVNQDLFVEEKGVEVILEVVSTVGFDCDDLVVSVIRAALQVLANVSISGVKRQQVVWSQFFPDAFLKIGKVRRRDTCDPLCMIIYTCTDGSVELYKEFCKNPGLEIMAEIVRTSAEVGYGEDWVKLLLSRICLEECHFCPLFNMINPRDAAENSDNSEICKNHEFASEQAYLLRILSEILNERLKEIEIHKDLALQILDLFERAAKVVDFDTRGQSGLPTGHTSIDILGYSLTMLRDICAKGGSAVSGSGEGQEDIVYSFISRGLLDLLLSLLRQLELPSSIRKTMKQADNQGLITPSPKVCPYKGFRRDIVAVIGNSAHGRKLVQDQVREKDGVILLLQQCVLDEDNPFLREWGIWCAKNLLEVNAENQQVVANLEMQGTMDVPELTTLGLRVEVDPNTKRAKLVNIT